MARKGGKVNRNIKTNSVGAGETPRLGRGKMSGRQFTTNIGKGTGSGGRSDSTDKTNFKRGDKKGPKGDNYLTDSHKLKRGTL